MKSFLYTATFAALATAATAQQYPEHYELTVNLQYEVNEATQGNAEQLGMEPEGTVAFDMVFLRPDCIAWYQSASGTYHAITSTLRAFDRSTEMDLRSEARIQIANDLGGAVDRLLFFVRPNIRLKTGQTIERMSVLSDVDRSALRSNAFITDRNLLREILQDEGTTASVFVAGSPQAAVVMNVVDADVTLTHQAGGQTSGQVPTCTPPAGYP